ncbi:phage scaffolding protein [Oscillospiraceae bacterium OttesenSCG-928-G22]|nr:phage scaffolding protein [Oscillospiraceae bacterium OttesenSCG-928-G22]
MERKFLEELGLDKEVINKVLDEHSADIGKHKQQITDLTSERDGLKSQLDGVVEKLKAFDGVDVEKLKGEIDTLKSDLATKEADFKAQLSDRDFQAMLSAEIAAAKAKNTKAVMSLLDVDALKASKNQKEDAAAAVKALLESDAYLFEATSDTTPAKVKTGGEHGEPNNNSSDPFVAAAMKGAGLDTGKDE